MSIKEVDSPYTNTIEYLNSLFMSNKVEDILKFYSYFNNREELIRWMRERPKGRAEIYEVEGNKDIIVVIPTVDFNGEYAKHCREDIFKSLHMIFVVSGGKDPYFNYAHNCNIGIKRAMGYGPKWIVVSNDDMYKIDDVTYLSEGLSKIDHNELAVVFAKPTFYHSVPCVLSSERLATKFAYRILMNNNLRNKRREIERRFGIVIRASEYMEYKNSLRTIKRLKSFLDFILLRQKLSKPFINTGSFAIFGGAFVRQLDGHLFDETFINGCEDIYLSFMMAKKQLNACFLDYKIGDYAGSILGNEKDRWFRNVASFAYFNYLLEKELPDSGSFYRIP